MFLLDPSELKSTQCEWHIKKYWSFQCDFHVNAKGIKMGHMGQCYALDGIILKNEVI